MNQHEEEQQEVFRGHFDECFQHFAARYLSQHPRECKDAHRSKEPIAQFCGVHVRTITDWIYNSGDCRAIGQSRIKIMFYLQMIGYRLIELERMPKTRRNFAELIAFGVLSPNDAAGILEYKKTFVLYDVLNEKQGISKEKENKMWDAWKERKEQLQLAKEKAEELYTIDLPYKSEKKSQGIPPVSNRFRAAVSVMEGLLAMLENGSFKDLTHSDLEYLRRVAGGLILRLTAKLSALGSRIAMDEQEVGGLSDG